MDHIQRARTDGRTGVRTYISPYTEREKQYLQHAVRIIILRPRTIDL